MRVAPGPVALRKFPAGGKFLAVRMTAEKVIADDQQVLAALRRIDEATKEAIGVTFSPANIFVG